VKPWPQRRHIPQVSRASSSSSSEFDHHANDFNIQQQASQCHHQAVAIVARQKRIQAALPVP
jgi:hypothetical protein